MMLNSRLLQDKVALVTGSNRGIGKAIAFSFVMHGAIVYASARKEGSLDELISSIPVEFRQNIKPLYFDVNDSDAAKKAFVKINKDQRQLDCFVNNAGIMKDALIGMVQKQLVKELFDTNVFAVIDLLQYASKLMIRRKAGSIINISSIVGERGNPGQIAYSATKGAVIAITKTAAKELAPNNIRVNAIAPGIINTDMLNSIGDERVSNLNSKIGMGRMGNPEDIANAVVFLASDLSEYVTGQVISVDGSTIM